MLDIIGPDDLMQETARVLHPLEAQLLEFARVMSRVANLEVEHGESSEALRAYLDDLRRLYEELRGVTFRAFDIDQEDFDDFQPSPHRWDQLYKAAGFKVPRKDRPMNAAT